MNYDMAFGKEQIVSGDTSIILAFAFALFFIFIVALIWR